MKKIFNEKFKYIYRSFNSSITTIPQGYCFELSKNHMEIKRYHPATEENLDPANCLEYVLKKYVKYKNIAISFSGGLDSTAILYACKNVLNNSNLIAYTWKNNNSSNEDIMESRRICSDMNIKLLEFDIQNNLLLSPIKPKDFIPMPSTHLGFINFNHYINDQIYEYFGDKFCNLNGHGGDHIFFETVLPEDILIESFSKPKQILNYLDLYSINIFKFIGSYRKIKKNSNIREKLIYEALFQNSIFEKNVEKYEYFFPFTTYEMISCSSHYPIIESFDSKFSRVKVRESLQKKYKSSNFFRKNKGHMTGAYQKALSSNLDFYKNLILDGYLNNHKLIDSNQILKELEISSLGVNGFNFNTFLIIIFELQIKMLRDNRYEIS